MTAHVDTLRESDRPTLIGPVAARSTGTDMVCGLEAQRKILARRKTTKSTFLRPGLGDIPLEKWRSNKHFR
jgi:ABC-type hemin transport system substrate-binding protein